MTQSLHIMDALRKAETALDQFLLRNPGQVGIGAVYAGLLREVDAMLASGAERMLLGERRQSMAGHAPAAAGYMLGLLSDGTKGGADNHSLFHAFQQLYGRLMKLQAGQMDASDRSGLRAFLMHSRYWVQP